MWKSFAKNTPYRNWACVYLCLVSHTRCTRCGSKYYGVTMAKRVQQIYHSNIERVIGRETERNALQMSATFRTDVTFHIYSYSMTFVRRQFQISIHYHFILWNCLGFQVIFELFAKLLNTIIPWTKHIHTHLFVEWLFIQRKENFFVIANYHRLHTSQNIARYTVRIVVFVFKSKVSLCTTFRLCMCVLALELIFQFCCDYWIWLHVPGYL